MVSRQACDEALAVFGAVMSGRYAEPEASLVPHPSVRHARDLLAEHLDAPPALQGLADAAGLGKYQLLRRRLLRNDPLRLATSAAW